MSDNKSLEFQDKYDAAHSLEYFHKHNRGLRRKVSNWVEQRMLARALRKAGNPSSILDLPCGTGRFWALLARRADRRLMAGDYSQSMIDTARRFRAPQIAGRFECFQTSAFDIKQSDGIVETIVCMRLLHHIGDPADRQKILREFHRVASRSVIFSCWVEGNLQATRRKKLEKRREKRSYQNRFVFEPARIEKEMKDAGFEILGHVDMLPHVSMWRTYVLGKR
ncbi:MAG TPA: class I SAM-dependent methyltransferase [Burkholderiales bacterium]|nr:class I SAM-dependent methyltransferase [Burkholderiales bacterium]